MLDLSQPLRSGVRRLWPFWPLPVFQSVNSWFRLTSVCSCHVQQRGTVSLALALSVYSFKESMNAQFSFLCWCISCWDRKLGRNMHYCWKLLFVISKILKEINPFVQQGCIKCIELSIYQRILKKRCHDLHKNIKQHNLIILRNVSWAANQYIRMISEGSCDTEDWSNDAENSALCHRNKLFKIEKLF